MKLLLVIIVVFVVLAAIALAVRKRRDSALTDEPWPFYAKKPLTNPEQVLYHRLVKALPECIVLAQVQLSRILGVKKGFNFGYWYNRINRMSVDFLVCLKDSTVVTAIELDDSSHHDPLRQEADAKKDRALRAAGITILRWSVTSLPDEAAIRAAITDPASARFDESAESVRREPHL